MPARVLPGLAGLNGGDQSGHGGQFLWENSCYHTVIPYQGPVLGSHFQLDEVVTACQRGTCVSVCCAFVCMCVSAEATYSCQTSVDKHGHP